MLDLDLDLFDLAVVCSCVVGQIFWTPMPCWLQGEVWNGRQLPMW